MFRVFGDFFIIKRIAIYRRDAHQEGMRGIINFKLGGTIRALRGLIFLTRQLGNTATLQGISRNPGDTESRKHNSGYAETTSTESRYQVKHDVLFARPTLNQSASVFHSLHLVIVNKHQCLSKSAMKRLLVKLLRPVVQLVLQQTCRSKVR